MLRGFRNLRWISYKKSFTLESRGVRKPSTEMKTGEKKKKQRGNYCELSIVNIAIGDLFSLYTDCFSGFFFLDLFCINTEYPKEVSKLM